MPDLPNSLALTSIADDAEIIASDHRNNYSAIQTGQNALITALSGGTSGQFLRATDTDTVAWATVNGYLAATQKYTTLIDVVSSTTETDILQSAGYTIPANTLGASGAVRVRVIGDFLNNTGGAVNLTPRVYFGGSKVWDLGAISYAASANRTPFDFELYLANLGATNSQYFVCRLPVLTTAGGLTTGVGGNVTAGGMWVGGATGTLAVDTTSGALLRMTAQLGTSSANAELRIRQSLIEFI